MTAPLLLIVPGLASAAVSAGLAVPVRRLALALGAIDRPAPRKIHRRPIPRLGGLAIIASCVSVFSILAFLVPGRGIWPRPGLAVGVGLGLLPILVVSVCDDIRSIPAIPRFVAHAVGAIIAIAFGVVLSPTVHLFGAPIVLGMWAVPLSMLWLMGLTNAFNIVDGLDGLSAGLALISAGSLAAVFAITHQPGMAIAALVIAGAIMGFLPYNLYPAKIFLGDTGATAIGFTLACLALRSGSTLSAGFAVLMPVFVLGLPLAETLVSMVRRVLHRLSTHEGNGIMEADRNHFHHRLLDLGVDHRRAVLLLYAVGLFFASCAMLSILMTALEAGLLLMALLLAGLVGIARLGYEEFAFIRRGVVLRFYEAPVLRRSLFAVFVDLALVSLAVYAAIVLKFEDVWLSQYHDLAMRMVAVLAPITVACFWAFGLYHGTWRLASVRDFFCACLAVTTSAFVGFLVYQLVSHHSGSLALFGIYALVKVALANGGRISYRILLDKQRRAINRGVPVLIYGAGYAGVAAERELLSNTDVGMRPVAFIDDDERMAGKWLNGYPIAGGVRDLEAAICRFRPWALVVSSSKIPRARIASARSVCRRLDVRVLRMNISFESYESQNPANAERDALEAAMAGSKRGLTAE